jgi:hypothetical protein
MPILYLHAFAPLHEPPCKTTPWVLLREERIPSQRHKYEGLSFRKKGVIFYPLDFCSGSIYFELESVADLIQDKLP